MTHRIARLIPATVILAALTGCGGSVSQSNYDKVNTGMTQAQVEDILGKGKEQASTAMPGVGAGGMSVPGMSAKVLQWQDGSKSITVTFMNDKVVSKAQNGL